MRVCDVCYLGVGKDIVRLEGTKFKKPGGGNYDTKLVWEGGADGQPEFCNDCFQALQKKDWSALGHRHDDSMEKLLRRTQTEEQE